MRSAGPAGTCGRPVLPRRSHAAIRVRGLSQQPQRQRPAPLFRTARMPTGLPPIGRRCSGARRDAGASRVRVPTVGLLAPCTMWCVAAPASRRRTRRRICRRTPSRRWHKPGVGRSAHASLRTRSRARLHPYRVGLVGGDASRDQRIPLIWGATLKHTLDALRTGQHRNRPRSPAGADDSRPLGGGTLRSRVGVAHDAPDPRLQVGIGRAVFRTVTPPIPRKSAATIMVAAIAAPP